ncbi:MAG: recombination protein RecR [Candidatus Yanofskybacteria bacterium RIFCSPHIGHO2_01_FULL_41_21]|uniref:Recombination protein RecR n=1 Tax=Candidatus Yanofskybacteria bacterium RIFCSPHIGHO2_01_FULL_41_21 TaxID=1802660 RepID=A0A1F8EAH5_9BACT|nr:MAG: recombination protein RecR [Candidatus Yanofskybacteria bacterium RIFCSPHIGHO2_01_FULL_41_21]
MDERFKQIAKLFQRLPGVGPRQAVRFVLALLDKPDSEIEELGYAISHLKQDISFCNQCFNISDSAVCSVCSNPSRDRTKMLVVEKVTDLDSIEKTGLYKGLYHVLGGAINPLDNVLPDNLRIKHLESRINVLTESVKEVELILAMNPNTPGETTALYLKSQFTDKPNVLITRLGRGLASGSHLEYADESTLKHALEFRK